LYVEQHWPLVVSAVLALLVFAPLLGMALYLMLFRNLRNRPMLVKLMATMGLSVALPPLVTLIFGHLTSVTAPGLAPRPLKVFHLFGAVVNTDQVATYIGLVVVLVLGVGVLRFTEVGLKVRALVDSEALTSLSGTNPNRVSLGVWAVSATMAGLAGVLLAPTAGLSSDSMTSLMAVAFAAVVAARLRSLPTAVVVGLLMGVATTVVQRYLNATSSFSAAVVPSVPFAFMLVFLLYYALRGQAVEQATGGALDRAIAPQGGDPTALRSIARPGSGISVNTIGSVVFVIAVAVLPLVLDDYWAGLAAAGIALGIALLAYTLVTGEGGMVWLCQITFAGLGAVIAAELATSKGWPVLPAVLVASILVVPLGVAIGALTTRLGDLYVVLVTLTFGLLLQTLVLTRGSLYNFGSGVAMPRPGFALDNRPFAYLALVVFLVLGVLVVNVRRSTAGLALSAVRWSEDGSRTLGLSVVQSKVLVAGLATFVAAVGGGFLAMNFQSTLPDSFNPFIGLVWLAVLVTLGSRSVLAALASGLAFYLMPGLFQSYLPTDLADVPTILFGLGAIGLASHPEGAIAQAGSAVTQLFGRWGGRGRHTGPVEAGETGAVAGPTAETIDPLDTSGVVAEPVGPSGLGNLKAGERA
jgi:branched-chain amino acid transport system permease protein